MKTFSCDFGDGILCTVYTVDEAPPEGQPHIIKMLWAGDRRPKHYQKYMYWMNSVNKQLSDEWKYTFIHVYRLHMEIKGVWLFEPDRPPKDITRQFLDESKMAGE